MAVIVKGEFMKLKRYFIVWIGVSLMLLNVLLTLFTSLAEDGMKWDFQFLCEQVIKNFVTMIFPMCITCVFQVLLQDNAGGLWQCSDERRYSERQHLKRYTG